MQYKLAPKSLPQEIWQRMKTGNAYTVAEIESWINSGTGNLSPLVKHEITEVDRNEMRSALGPPLDTTDTPTQSSILGAKIIPTYTETVRKQDTVQSERTQDQSYIQLILRDNPLLFLFSPRDDTYSPRSKEAIESLSKPPSTPVEEEYHLMQALTESTLHSPQLLRKKGFTHLDRRGAAEYFRNQLWEGTGQSRDLWERWQYHNATQRLEAELGANRFITAEAHEIDFADIREDFTGHKVYAVDDADAHEIDDAFSWTDSHIYVHIADPTAAIKFDSLQAKIAQRKVQTLYYPHAVVPMLKTRDITGGHRPTLTWKIDRENGEGRLLLGIIKDVQRVSYHEVDSNKQFPEMFRFTDMLRQRRKFALDLDLPQAAIRVEPHPHEPFPIANRNSITRCDVNLTLIPDSLARRMIAELMIHCNGMMAAIASRAKVAIPFRTMPAILRPESTDNTRELLSRVQDGLATLAERYLLVSELAGGRTEATCRPHALLGLNGYARSTSPLRRYSDLVTHWQIKSLFANTVRAPFSFEEMVDICKDVSASELEAQRSMRASMTFWGLRWLESRNQEFDVLCVRSDRGKVMDIGLDVELEDYRRREVGTIQKMQCKNSRVVQLDDVS